MLTRRHSRGLSVGLLLLGAAVLSGQPAARSVAETAPAGESALFREKVRTILVNRCVGCHGEKGPQAGLDLGTRAGLLKGSAARPVLVPGKPVESHFFRRVSDGTMPPKGRLPQAEIDVLRSWIEAGAPWDGGRLAPPSAAANQRAGADWWSLQPLRPVSPPAAAPVSTVPADSRSIDAFVGQKLQKAGLQFAPEASPAHYIRRVTYDLHGLPPTPEEVAAFVRECEAERAVEGVEGRVEGANPPDPRAKRAPSPAKPYTPRAPRGTPPERQRGTLPEQSEVHSRANGAYERLVDRLLASPRYGERMARRWLDAVRFAESDGYEHDLPRANAWPYRDWVIEAFNRDLPYDQFLREQLAGDALHPGDPQAFVPTGFLVAGGHDSVGAAVVSEIMRNEVRQDELEDMIGTTMQVFVGMTAQCARCHDHKFDPISQKEYYRIGAALAGAHHYGPKRKSPLYAVRSEAPGTARLLVRGSVLSPGEEVQPGALAALRMLTADLRPTPDSDPARRLALAKWVTDSRNPLTPRVAVNRIWGWLFGQGLVATPNDFGFNGDRPSHAELLEWLASVFSTTATSSMAQGGRGAEGLRSGGTLVTAAGAGNNLTPPAPLSGFGEGGDSGSSRVRGAAGSQYVHTDARRGALRHTQYADIAPRKPSTPSNPGLGWSTKRLIRALVLSRTYRQSARWEAKAARVDASNRLLWRHEARRLESEEVRDAMLRTAGKLNLQMGGPGFRLFTFKDNAGALYQQIDPEGDEFCRRAVYRMVVRGGEDPLLTSLDCPDPSNTTPRRASTTTATQALSLLNNSFVNRHSGALAERLRREAGDDAGAQVRLSYRLALGREPRAEEQARVLAFVRQRGLKAWCRVLFNTNEFLYVD